ncbi:STAS domain-containing protein [Streptomyces sp. SYSU K217416]
MTQIHTLTLTVQQASGPLALVSVTGDIDIETAPVLRAGALDLIDQGHPHLILDLSPVAFCDSSGLNALIGILRCARDAGGSLALSAVPDRLARLLDLTGVSQLMPAHPDAEAALAAHAHHD